MTVAESAGVIYVVDDDPSVRKALRRLTEGRRDPEVSIRTPPQDSSSRAAQMMPRTAVSSTSGMSKSAATWPSEV